MSSYTVERAFKDLDLARQSSAFRLEPVKITAQFCQSVEVLQFWSANAFFERDPRLDLRVLDVAVLILRVAGIFAVEVMPSKTGIPQNRVDLLCCLRDLYHNVSSLLVGYLFGNCQGVGLAEPLCRMLTLVLSMIPEDRLRELSDAIVEQVRGECYAGTISDDMSLDETLLTGEHSAHALSAHFWTASSCDSDPIINVARIAPVLRLFRTAARSESMDAFLITLVNCEIDAGAFLGELLEVSGVSDKDIRGASDRRRSTDYVPLDSGLTSMLLDATLSTSHCDRRITLLLICTDCWLSKAQSRAGLSVSEIAGILKVNINRLLRMQPTSAQHVELFG